MGSYFVKILLAVFVCLVHTKLSILGFNSPSYSSQVRCIERERQALLNFKQTIRDYYGMLSMWRDDENKRDCCKWEGIECNNETGHIEMIDLRGSESHYLSGSFNISSLIDLQKLEYLDLSLNHASSGQIPASIGSFQSLIYLNLSHSSFSGTIPYELGNLSKLEYLDLETTDLDGEVPSQLGKLSSLRYLDLSENNDIYGEVPSELGTLSHLRYLDLSGNSLSGALPFQVGNLPLLHSLSLSGSFDLPIDNANWLSSLYSLTALGLDSIPNLGSSPHWLQMISQHIPNLRKLSLVSCSLSDDHISSLFRSHSNISTSLSILDLSDNMLTSLTFQLLSNYSLNLQELYLSSNNIILSSPHYLNFPSLVILNLSKNNLKLTSSRFQENFNFSTKLQELLLENCQLTDRSFLLPTASFKDYSFSLVTLDLSNNLLKSSAIFHWIFNFTTNLQSLSLSGNLFESPIPDGFGKVMSSLKFLDLDSNKLKGEIPASLGNICTLQVLRLGHNNLSGEISSFIQNSSRCNNPAFELLDLSNNLIIGKLPSLSAFTSLRMLYLSSNQLTGEIPQSIGLLYQLQSLHLEENNLKGDINELHLTNLSQLEELDLSDNLLSLTFRTSWIPPFQLFNLGLASCKLGRSFPSWLQSQSQLSFLDISDAGIDDFVPYWFWNKLQFINELNMSHNNLKGPIPNLTIKFVHDGPDAIILNSNKLEGVIPTFLQNANALDLSENKFSDLNTLLCGNKVTKIMRSLDLSNNQIAGELPDCWEHLSSLQYLDLRNNKLSGKIPQSMGTLVNLKVLVLRNNNFIEELPLTLKNCSSLSLLDVSENLLSSSVPSWIGESMQQLTILSLRINRFFGSVPVHLCYLRQIQVLDLSRNKLSGEIPACLRNFSAMMDRSILPREIVRERKISTQWSYDDIYDSYLQLTWKGQDHEVWKPENLLKSIDLSSNDLTGEVPKDVGYLIGLVSLNLSRNNFHGQIPSEIGYLSLLDFLDLSKNNFSGSIPSTISNIDRLAVLDLSNNNLSGRIPWGRQLQTFDGSSFEGNIYLCGKQLNKSCPGDEKTVQPQGAAVDGEDGNSVLSGVLYMSLGVGFFTGFWGLLGSILLWRQWRFAYNRFLNRLVDYMLLMLELNVVKFHRWLKC